MLLDNGLIDTGETGVVYKAFLDTLDGTELVAIKTVKGKQIRLVWISKIKLKFSFVCIIGCDETDQGDKPDGDIQSSKRNDPQRSVP